VQGPRAGRVRVCWRAVRSAFRRVPRPWPDKAVVPAVMRPHSRG
jgi:hypothetical protein